MARLKTYRFRVPRRGARMKRRAQLDPDLDRELEGPFIIQGKSATDIEWRVYRALRKEGVTDDDIGFQVDYFGGRQFSGGLVIDFVVQTVPLPTLIYVNGNFFHEGAAQQDEDLFEQSLVESRMNGQVRVITLWGNDLQTQDHADAAVRALL